MAPQTRLQARVTFSHPLSLRDLLKIFPQLLSYHIVPLIVLDYVALVFREEMGPFIDEVTREADHLHTTGFRHPKDCRRDLKSMSLVHRVWTGPAQRALRYRVVLTSSESTERFLTNQMCGPWIRELWIKIPEEAKNEPELEPEQVSDSDTDSSYEPSPEDDVDVDSDSDFDMDIVSSDFDVLDAESIIMPYHFGHVLELLKRTPNPRFLAVELGELFQEIGQLSIERILHSISQMSQLEGLCFLPSTVGIGLRVVYPYFTSLCETLPFLHSLRFLWIENWCCAEEQVDSLLSPQLLNCSPPPCLKTIILTVTKQPYPETYLGWLLRPTDTYTLENLLLRDGVGNTRPYKQDLKRFLSAASRHCLSIQRLHVDIFVAEIDEIYRNAYLIEDLQVVLSHCSSLRSINFTVPNTNYRTREMKLPPSIEEILFLIDEDKEIYSLFSGIMEGSSLPRLRKLVLVSSSHINNDSSPLRFLSLYEGINKRGLESQFPRTADVCRRTGIELVYQGQHEDDDDRPIARFAKFAM